MCQQGPKWMGGSAQEAGRGGSRSGSKRQRSLRNRIHPAALKIASRASRTRAQRPCQPLPAPAPPPKQLAAPSRTAICCPKLASNLLRLVHFTFRQLLYNSQLHLQGLLIPEPKCTLHSCEIISSLVTTVLRVNINLNLKFCTGGVTSLTHAQLATLKSFCKHRAHPL